MAEKKKDNKGGGQKPSGGKPEKGEGGGKKGKGEALTGGSGKLEKIALRLKDKYQSEVAPAMKERFKYDNVMMIPRLEKVVVNMGVGEAIANPKVLDNAVGDMLAITGQRPVVTKSKKAISNFKLRAGVKIGAKVTLRGPKMWAFLDKLFNLVLPRIRDFRGLSNKSFDGRGNYSFGLKEQIIFPEIDYDKVDKVRGMDICIVTTAKNDEEGAEFLRMLGCPIRKQ